MNNRILYLSYDGMTDPLGQSQVIPYLEGLSEKGWQITLVSFEKPQNQGLMPFIQKNLDGMGISWQPLTYHKSPAVLSTLWDLYILRKLLIRLNRKAPFALVHCRGYITAILGKWMQEKLGVRFVFDMRGFFADERVEGGLWNQKNPAFRAVYRYFKGMEKSFLAKADHTICLTHRGNEIIQNWGIHEKPTPVQVIPCCADLALFDPETITSEQKSAWRKSLNIPEKAKVITYLGSIGTWYMLEEMLDFFIQLCQKYTDVVLLFITAESVSQLREQLKRKGIPSQKVFITKAQRKEVPQLLSLSYASLFFIKPSFSKQASSPTKQGELMSMGIPVICNAGVGDTAFVVEGYGSGILVEEFTKAAYAEAIDQFDYLGEFDKDAIRKGAKDFYSLEKGIEAYHQVYKNLLESVEQGACTIEKEAV